MFLRNFNHYCRYWKTVIVIEWVEIIEITTIGTIVNMDQATLFSVIISANDSLKRYWKLLLPAVPYILFYNRFIYVLCYSTNDSFDRIDGPPPRMNTHFYAYILVLSSSRQVRSGGSSRQYIPGVLCWFR